MNNSYAIENGKVFVGNQDGVIATREYDDNIEQILVEENILENIQDEIKEIEQSDLYQSKLNKTLISPKVPYLTIIALGTFVLVTLIPDGNPNATLDLIGDIMGGSLCTSLGVLGDYLRYQMNKHQMKREERYTALKELEVKQKSKIESLKKEKNKKNIKTNVASITLDHSKEEEKINMMVQEYIDNLSHINSTMEEQGPIKKLTR